VPTGPGDGAAIVGRGSGTIRRNRIFDSHGRAIQAWGGTQVIDNLVEGVSETFFSIANGIEVYDSSGALVRGNTVRGLLSTSPNPADRRAVNIYNDTGDLRTVVADNVLVHDGPEGALGITCDSGVRVSDNVITGFFLPLNNFCVDAGDNDITP
jgi:hypothetical protein